MNNDYSISDQERRILDYLKKGESEREQIRNLTKENIVPKKTNLAGLVAGVCKKFIEKVV